MPDPTSREERRRQARPGYDQNSRWQYGEPAAPAAPVKIPSAWDKVPGEIAESARAFAPQGTPTAEPWNPDTSIRPPGKSTWMQESAQKWRDVRSRRIAQAGMGEYPPIDESFNPPRVEPVPAAAPPPEQPRQPIMSKEVMPTKQQTDYPPSAVADGAAPAGTRETTRGSVGVAARGGQVPTTAADAEYINRQPVTVDPRKRYFDMAGMSLEQRNAMLDAMPEGQRPIQTIRGNTEGWYNPSLSKEFSGLPQALTGVEGRPTLQSENMREQEARDRVSHEGIAGARNATALAMEDKRQTGANARSADGSKGGKSTEWKEFVQKGQDANGNPTEETVVWNPAAGPHTIISPRKTPAKAIASAIIGDFQNEKARDGWLPLFERLDADKVSEIASAMPPEVKEHYRKSLIDKIKESEKDKKAKGK